MKFYIATRGSDPSMSWAKALAMRLVALGHEITYEWWVDIERERARARPDEALTPAERREHATKDFTGVRDAEVFVYLEPHDKSEGSACEHGGAYMKRLLTGTPIVVVIGPRRSFIFSELCDYRLDHEDKLIDMLDRLEHEFAWRTKYDRRNER